jgi:hypothetical protein
MTGIGADVPCPMTGVPCLMTGGPRPMTDAPRLMIGGPRSTTVDRNLSACGSMPKHLIAF